MDLGLSNKRALVLASSDGLGKTVAAELIAEGAQVVISSRNEAKLIATAAEIGASSYIVSDLSQPGSATNLVNSAAEKLGGIDILVTNAGGPPPGTFVAVEQRAREDEEFRKRHSGSSYRGSSGGSYSGGGHSYSGGCSALSDTGAQLLLIILAIPVVLVLGFGGVATETKMLGLDCRV